MAYKRNYEQQLQKQLKKRLILTIAIPAVVLFGFVFFGPKIASLFGFISVNRGGVTNKDSLAPTAPIFKNPPNAVKETKLKLEGFAETGSTVKLFVNGPEKAETITTNDGTFTFEEVELIKGRNTLFAKAYDQENNESEKSETLIIVFDTESPEIEVEEPKPDSTVKNLNERITIKGTVNEKVKLKINDRVAILRPDLSFEFLLGVKEGGTTIKIEAEDEAGNITVEEFKVNYVKSSN